VRTSESLGGPWATTRKCHHTAKGSHLLTAFGARTGRRLRYDEIHVSSVFTSRCHPSTVSRIVLWLVAAVELSQRLPKIRVTPPNNTLPSPLSLWDSDLLNNGQSRISHLYIYNIQPCTRVRQAHVSYDESLPLALSPSRRPPVHDGRSRSRIDLSACTSVQNSPMESVFAYGLSLSSFGLACRVCSIEARLVYVVS
jgi:hypothetical protein